MFEEEEKQKHSEKRKNAMGLLTEYLEAETSEVEAIQNEIEEIWDKLNNLRGVSQSNIEKIEVIENSLNSTQQDVADSDNDIEELKEQLSNTNMEVSKANDDIIAAKAEVESIQKDLCSEIEELKAKYADCKEISDSAYATSQEAKEICESFKAEVINIRNEYEERLAQTRTEILLATEKKIDGLRDIIMDQKILIDEQAKIIEELRRANAELKKRIWRDNIIAIIISAASLGTALCILAYFMSMH